MFDEKSLQTQAGGSRERAGCGPLDKRAREDAVSRCWKRIKTDEAKWALELDAMEKHRVRETK